MTTPSNPYDRLGEIERALRDSTELLLGAVRILEGVAGVAESEPRPCLELVRDTLNEAYRAGVNDERKARTGRDPKVEDDE
jgi:hypothetical protein